MNTGPVIEEKGEETTEGRAETTTEEGEGQTRGIIVRAMSCTYSFDIRSTPLLLLFELKLNTEYKFLPYFTVFCANEIQ